MLANLPMILTVLRLIAAPMVAIIFVIVPPVWAGWIALFLFVAASATDFLDGYLARKWQVVSPLGAMLDPIADKAMVITALAVVMGFSAGNPWIIIPAAFILLREVFVSGLREFLGADAGKLQVTKLAKWKTTSQMVAISVLLFSIAMNFTARAKMGGSGSVLSPDQDYLRLATVNGLYMGVLLLNIAAVLTVVTGYDYFRKAKPFLKID
ncbi:CDP-diacylglycerol--glycerol-3-phosphate 3-phosphatidyltransferase [Paracoccaceae bacterium GXU_MW_L88]